ncbi:MAG: hypothetical protein RR400_02820, partial [Clostridia bacterium]
KKFRPEFLNRIDVITVFDALTKENLERIATLLVSNLNKRLEKNGISLNLTVDALAHIVENGADGEYGARPLKRFITQHIEDQIAEKILIGELDKNGTITIDAQNGELIFSMA